MDSLRRGPNAVFPLSNAVFGLAMFEGRLLELGCEISKSATMAVISRNGIAMLKATPNGRLMFINQAYSTSAAMCATLSPA